MDADHRGEAIDPGQGLLLLSQRYCVDPEDLDAWTIAENFSASSCAIRDPALRAFARRLATRAVLRKAWNVVGPVRSATRPMREILSEPFRGELDEELTIENIMGKEFPDPEDWIAVRREAPRRQIVLMMDTSLSMSGRNLALASVAAAVLAFKVKPEDLAVVAFENQAHSLSRLYDRTSVGQSSRRSSANRRRASRTSRTRSAWDARSFPGGQSAETGPSHHGRRIHGGKNPIAQARSSRSFTSSSPRIT